MSKLLELGSSVLLVEIASPEARHLVGNKDGRTWDFWVQSAYAGVGSEEAYPVPFEVQLMADGKSYDPGFYVLSAGSLRSGRRGVSLDFSGHRMVPISAALGDLQRVQGLLGVPGGAKPLRAAS